MFFQNSNVLDIAREREVEGDLVHADMGDGLPFKAGAFDGAISISALQWLCNADKSYHRPAKRLFTFFTSLYACLVRFISQLSSKQRQIAVCTMSTN